MVCTRTETICGETEATHISIINNARSRSFGGEVTDLTLTENARREIASYQRKTCRLRNRNDLLKLRQRPDSYYRH